METFEIADFIDYFNTATVGISLFFAIFGIFAILGKKLGWRFFRDRMFFAAFCAASLAALAVEVTVFNFQHYLKFFADSELHTTQVPPDNPNAIMTSEGTLAEIVTEQQPDGVISSGIKFKNIDRRITSVFADVAFSGVDMADMTIKWVDESGSDRSSITKKIYKHLPRENHAAFHTAGKVTEVTVMFSAAGAGTVSISSVALNRQVPFYFSGLRLLAVSLLFFAAFSFLNKKLRAKTAHYLFEYKFNPESKKQNLIYALMVIMLILFSWACVYTTIYSKSALDRPGHQMYNKYLADAVIEGRAWLDYGSPENLLNAEKPYNYIYRAANGYKMNSDWMWEWSWYKGKFYSYFGAVPAVILFAPYKLITGNYLSNHAGIFLFSVAGIILLALLWRFCVKKYMPDARFAFYLLSFLTLFFASGQFAVLNFPRFYSIPQMGALMFALAGILLLFKSVENEKINRLKLFFACLCLALLVGCRPNAVFVSLLVPVVLWKYRSWKLLAFIAIPYIIVAIPMCIYNYVRFDSIFQFGFKYMTTNTYHGAGAVVNPIAKIYGVTMSVMSFLFYPGAYSLNFPYMECSTNRVAFGFAPNIGMINFPIILCLLYLFKNITGKDKPDTFRVLSAFLIITVILMFIASYTSGASSRQIIDFGVFIILPSLFCAYYWCCERGRAFQHNGRLKVTYALLTISILAGLFLFVTGGLENTGRNPLLYRYLECSLGFFNGG